MGDRRRNLFVLLLVLGLLAASAVAIVTKKARLGLDLKGGLELVYQAEPTPQSKVNSEAIDRSLQIIRERVDTFGVAEPEIQRQGRDGISVGLPDIKDPERAVRQIGSTAQLYFYDWERNVIGNPDQPTPQLYTAVTRASKQKPRGGGTTKGLYYLFDKGKKLIGGPDAGKQDLLQPFDGEAPQGSKIIHVPQGTLVVRGEKPGTDVPKGFNPGWYVIRDKPELKGTDIKKPEQGFDQNNQPNVNFQFTGRGQDQFQKVTRRIAQRGQAQAIPGTPAQNTFQHFAIVLDNKVISRPFIDYNQNPDGIDGRTGAEISGGFQIQEAQDLANFLKIGALPVTLKLISQTQVSATLGKQALHQGLIAGVAGLLLTMIFLVFVYRFLGLIADLALVIYAVFFFALIKMIPITMTLPGIAGLVLTIGVAADANIVIFERIKEEYRAGRSPAAAIAAGYKKGFATILDANVITFITAFILFILATAGVKGFAFTLGIGVLVSMLTAVLATQAILGSMRNSPLLRRPSMLGAARQRFRWHFDFMGASRWFFSLSGCILAIGAIAFATKGINYGIDFTSGTRITTNLDRTTDENGVRKALGPLGLSDAKIQRQNDPDIGNNVFQIATKQLQTDEVGKVRNVLDRKFGVQARTFSTESVGPTFGKQVARSAIYALIFSLLAIVAYISFRFELKFSIPAIIALFHDILITLAIYALVGRELTSATVAALLTILGYSLYDTVIVFDRIRENQPRMPRAAFSQIVNRSMSEVMTRSLMTSFSTLVPVAALMFFGGQTLRDFAFALLVGIASGTYSSIFIASPVLTAWKEREPAYARRRVRIIDEYGGQVPAFAMAGDGTGEAPAAEEPAEEEPRPSTARDRMLERKRERERREAGLAPMAADEAVAAPAGEEAAEQLDEPEVSADGDGAGNGRPDSPPEVVPDPGGAVSSTGGRSGKPSKAQRRKSRQRQRRRRRGR